MALLVAELPVPLLAVVGNKVRSVQDEDAIKEFCDRHGLGLAGTVPWSDEVVSADRASVPVVEWPGARAVVSAVSALAANLGMPSPSSASTG